jgi:hypothetical protein
MKCALSSCSEAAKRKCAACKSLGYCSREHQRSDWKDHKKECQRIVKAEAASGEGGAAGGGVSEAAAPEGKDAGGGDGGEVAEQPTTVARHDTLRAMMEEDAFDINTTPCGPRGLCALFFALGIGGWPVKEEVRSKPRTCGEGRMKEEGRFLPMLEDVKKEGILVGGRGKVGARGAGQMGAWVQRGCRFI